MAEENSKGLCARCGNQLEGQPYDWIRDEEEKICQRCKLELLDQQIKYQEDAISFRQAKFKDFKQRRERVSKNLSEFCP